ncbi:hypothetical protein F2Q70_00037572 [Brassica cretica]|uniref:Uncharacterized protein n=1 Tax=Brassica cretica TaxID=69181 RepID=A0A8S9K0G5_BRACR|nr:hypothetical protein F2Q70_00037572 [Brassica cretica]
MRGPLLRFAREFLSGRTSHARRFCDSHPCVDPMVSFTPQTSRRQPLFKLFVKYVKDVARRSTRFLSRVVLNL